MTRETAPFAIPPPPIPKSEIKGRECADVVIAGAGMAGLMAAFAANKAGASVLILEKAATFSARGADITAIGSRLQKQAGIEIDTGEVLKRYMKVQGGRIHQHLYQLWFKNSGRVMDILLDFTESKGMENVLMIPAWDEPVVVDKWPVPTGAPEGWHPDQEYTYEYPTCHRLGGVFGWTRGWLGKVEEHLRENGVRIMYNTPVVRIIREEQGKVQAYIAETQDGYIEVTANKGFVLATGDYSANEEMVKHYFPLQTPQLGMIATSMGEGHKMAMWIGAQMERTPHAPLMDMTHIMGTDAFLFVNKLGERFCNEDLDSEAMARQGEEQGGSWVVFDSSWPEDVPKMGLGFCRVYKETPQGHKRLADSVEKGRAIKADTIEELATKMNVPVQTFRKTIDRYNELAAKGVDEDFGKQPSRLTAVDTPPYYAGWSPLMNEPLLIFGGLVTNERLQPLQEDGKPIEGIYLAGNTVGGRFKQAYPLMCPGVSHGQASTLGYLAGEFASGKK